MSPVRKRTSFFSRKNIRLLLSGVVLLPVLAAAAVLMVLAWSLYHSVYMQPLVYAQPPAPTFRAARKTYPFSIIPGGVYDPKELEKSIQADPSLADHYRDVKVEQLIAVRTQAPMLAYVSFRRQGQILWTNSRLTIPRGELVLTDGHEMIRSRCGNRIAQEKPAGAVHSGRSEVPAEDAEYMALDAPLPSIVNLPPRLQPVLSPGVVVSDIWKETDRQPSQAPEPQALALFGSAILLMLVIAGINRA